MIPFIRRTTGWRDGRLQWSSVFLFGLLVYQRENSYIEPEPEKTECETTPTGTPKAIKVPLGDISASSDYETPPEIAGGWRSQVKGFNDPALRETLRRAEKKPMTQANKLWIDILKHEIILRFGAGDGTEKPQNNRGEKVVGINTLDKTPSKWAIN